jgi:hypothetical protein
VIGTARACTVRVVSESREDKGETGKARLSKVIKPHRSRSKTSSSAYSSSRARGVCDGGEERVVDVGVLVVCCRRVRMARGRGGRGCGRTVEDTRDGGLRWKM